MHGLYIQNVNVNGVRYVLLPLAESGIEHASTLSEWGNRAHFFQSLRTTLACPISVFDLSRMPEGIMASQSDESTSITFSNDGWRFTI